eukprot:COSAG04_NODE_2233_length_4479_cov_3.295205_3_plen_180_part_00
MPRYYKSPTLRESPTPQIRGLNLKGPSPRPRGRGIWRPQENKTQPTATASTGGKKVICGRNAQKCQKYFVGKCPSGARINRSTGGLNRNYIALNVWWRAAASNLEERPKTAENGRVWRVFLCRRPQAGGEKIYYVLLLVTINFLFPGATAPKQGRGTPTPRFRPLNLRVSARAILLRSR